MASTVDQTFRDYNTQGVPASGDHKPSKPEIRALLKQIQNAGGMSVTRNTFTALSAVTPPTENYMGIVLDDADATKNGYYSRVAAAWVWERGFPDTFGVLESVAGTANAITASAATGVNPADLQAVFLVPSATNTSGTVTIAINGGAATSIKAASGAALAVGDLVSGKGTLLYWTGVEWRQLVSSAAGATFDHQGDYAGGTTYTLGQVVTGSNGNWYQLHAASALGDNPVGSVTGNWLLVLTAGGVADGSITDIKVATPASAALGVSATKIGSSISSPSVHTALDVVLNGMSHIAVERFGVDGTDSAGDRAAWIKAFAEGVPLYAHGSYSVGDGLVYQTTTPDAPGLVLRGAGQERTIFNYTGSAEPFLTLNGYDAATFCFQRSGRLSGFSIIGTGSTLGASGIYCRAVWDAVFEQIKVKGLSGNGIKVEGGVPPGDPDSSANLIFNQVTSIQNGGYGFDFLSANGTVAIADVELRGCFATGNTLDGIRTRGVNLFRMYGGAAVGNGAAGVGGGLFIDYNGIDNRNFIIHGTEFGNGNHEYDIFARSVRVIDIDGTIHVVNAGEAAAAGIILGVTGEASGVYKATIGKPSFRVATTITPYTGIAFNGTVRDARVVQPDWYVFDAAGQVRYNQNSAAENVVTEEMGFVNRGVLNTTAASLTPNLDHAKTHRLNFSAAVAVNNPTTSVTLRGGERFTLILVNTSGGGLTPTFGSAYLTSAPLVATGKRRSADFQYDAASALWVQVGDWSTDL